MDYVLGVDISMTATGVAVLDRELRPTTWVVGTPPSGPLWSMRRGRALAAGRGILDGVFDTVPVIEPGPFLITPALLVVEGYSYGSGGRKRSSAENEKNVQGSVGRAHSIAEFGALVRAALYEGFATRPTLVEVPPATLKKFVTGKGNAPKDLMRVEAYKRWGVEFKTNDEVDAYGLARMGACLLGWEEPATKAQREAVEKVAHAQELSKED
jgi:crossover junction endodeoxyribonuclease RuvC